MNVKFDFVMHWFWTIVYILLAITGVTMISSKFGWVINFNIVSADIVHRVLAAVFIILTFVSIVYEAVRTVKNRNKKLPWFIFGSSGYQLFTFITSLIFIITGAIIWVCMGDNMVITGFAIYIHEKLTYIAIASVIWHIYKKCHALLWPVKKSLKPNKA